MEAAQAATPQAATPQVEIVTAIPAPPLRRLISSYIGYHVKGAPAGVHRGLPSRNLTVVLTIEGTVDLTPGRGPHRSLIALAGGLHDTAVMIERDGDEYGVQAQFTPLGSRALLGVPAGELASTVVDLGALLGRAADELIDRLRSAASWVDRFRHLDAVLSRAAVAAAVPPELAWAWQRLVDSTGRVAVSTLATEVGWSRQNLSARFHWEFGLTPKRVARVLRFEAAHRLLAGPRRPYIADVAAHCGYYDQAHLDRDWRAFTGLSPTDWLAEELPFVQDGTAGSAGT